MGYIGPYRTKREPNGTIQDHTGIYKTIHDHIWAHRSIQGDTGPYGSTICFLPCLLQQNQTEKSETESHLISKVISIKRRFPYMVVFLQRSSSIKCHIQSKAVFHHRSSPMKGHLPSRFVFLTRKDFYFWRNESKPFKKLKSAYTLFFVKNLHDYTKFMGLVSFLNVTLIDKFWVPHNFWDIFGDWKN